MLVTHDEGPVEELERPTIGARLAAADTPYDEIARRHVRGEAAVLFVLGAPPLAL